MNDETVTKGDGLRAFSAHELAAMRLPRYPTTPKGWYAVVKQPGWRTLHEPGKGPGGMRQVFVPPPDVMDLILTIEEANDRFFGSVKPPEIAARELVTPYNPPAPAAPDGFVLVPRYDVRGSMGNGHIIHSEQIVDHLAFRADWVRTELGTSPANLVLISAIGDSMEPTLRAGDLLLIDRSVEAVKHDAIYAFATDGELRVKRMQLKMDGSLVVKSDNTQYDPEILTPEQASTVHLVGRVVWSGRRM